MPYGPFLPNLLQGDVSEPPGLPNGTLPGHGTIGRLLLLSLLTPALPLPVTSGVGFRDEARNTVGSGFSGNPAPDTPSVRANPWPPDAIAQEGHAKGDMGRGAGKIPWAIVDSIRAATLRRLQYCLFQSGRRRTAVKATHAPPPRLKQVLTGTTWGGLRVNYRSHVTSGLPGPPWAHGRLFVVPSLRCLPSQTQTA